MFSDIVLYGENGEDVCGYCKSSQAIKSSFYIGTSPLVVRDYKILMDSGWRRCGDITYKPNNAIICCPAYTIRCDALEFRLSKSQKKVLKGMNKFLASGKLPKSSSKGLPSTDCRGDRPLSFNGPPDVYNKTEPKASGDIGSKPCEVSEAPVLTGRTGSAKRKRWQALQAKMANRAEQLGVPYEEILQEYLVRRKRRLDRNKPKEIEEYLENEKLSHLLDIRLCKITPKSEDFGAEYEVYRRYQMQIHHEPPSKVTKRGFTRFLVDHSLVSENDPAAEAAGAPQFGTYHQQYWLDGEKLIAVGVIDLVPGCLSSVYLFYDPEYAFLNLGTYAALREIAYVRNLHRTYGSTVPAYANFTDYYLGYYIHSCPKMRYKATFRPSYLSCPVTHSWVPVEKCQRLLDQAKFTRFAPDDVETPAPPDADAICLVLPALRNLLATLPSGAYTIQNGKVITTVGAMRGLLNGKLFDLCEAWARLILAIGTMRIKLS